MRTQIDWWRSLDGRSFEVAVGRVFAEGGYDVHWTGKSGDQGVDLVLRKGAETILVHCKAHKQPIGPAPVRELYGTLVHRRGKEAWLVSSSGFSRAAKEFAHGKPIRLIGVEQLVREATRT